MDDYTTIREAARQRDWEGCARLMFRRLYFCSSDAQEAIARVTLEQYLLVWDQKHPATPYPAGSRIEHISTTLSDIDQNLDPADAEFADAIFEYVNATRINADQSGRTKHFASAIRSAVLARQINTWIVHRPVEYLNWKSGAAISGPTFLNDEAAGQEAENGWGLVDDLLTGYSSKKAPEPPAVPRADQAYYEWESSLL